MKAEGILLSGRKTTASLDDDICGDDAGYVGSGLATPPETGTSPEWMEDLRAFFARADSRHSPVANVAPFHLSRQILDSSYKHCPHCLFQTGHAPDCFLIDGNNIGHLCDNLLEERGIVNPLEVRDVASDVVTREQTFVVPAARDIRDDTTRFLSLLFAPYITSSAARIELRCFPPDYDKRANSVRPPRDWFPLASDGFAHAAALAQRAAQRFEVYYGVLPRTQGGGGAAHLRRCAWLWADIDGGDEGPKEALALLRTATQNRDLPAPHIIVVSGGGAHAYWRLADPAPCRTKDEQDRLRRTLRRLVLAIGGEAPAAHADRASAEPARILRLPGTFNRKRPNQPRHVRLLRVDETAPAYPLVWWQAHLPAEPLPPRPKTRPDWAMTTPRFSSPPPAILRKLSGAPDGSKHYTMRDVAVWARKEGMSEDQIRNYTAQVAEASGVNLGDIDQLRHLDEIVRWTEQNVQPTN